MSHKKRQSLVILCILTISAWQWGQALFIVSKAYLAQYLIAQAWQQTLTTGQATKPWPWADTWPVAKMKFDKNHDHKTYYVLSGSTGNSLAFGPGHDSQTALPGTPGTSVIGGHRDTHFQELKHFQINDRISIQNQQGHWQHYQATKTRIVDSQQQALLIDPEQNQVLLITCYPFHQIIPGGSQRFIVEFGMVDLGLVGGGFKGELTARSGHSDIRDK